MVIAVEVVLALGVFNGMPEHWQPDFSLYTPAVVK